MTTPSDELRAAAKKLRTLAGAATPGPWTRPLNTRYRATVYAPLPDDELSRYTDVKPGERVSVVQCGTWSNGAFFRKRSGRDLDYIATMHPAVGLAVAAWLDGCAGQAADMPGPDDWGVCDEPGSVQQALAVARAINGEVTP